MSRADACGRRGDVRTADGGCHERCTAADTSTQYGVSGRGPASAIESRISGAIGKPLPHRGIVVRGRARGRNAGVEHVAAIWLSRDVMHRVAPERLLRVLGEGADGEVDTAERRPAGSSGLRPRIACPPDVVEDRLREAARSHGVVHGVPDVRPVHHEAASLALEGGAGFLLAGGRRGRARRRANARDRRRSRPPDRRPSTRSRVWPRRPRLRSASIPPPEEIDQRVDPHHVAFVAVTLRLRWSCPRPSAAAMASPREVIAGRIDAGGRRDGFAEPEDLRVRPQRHARRACHPSPHCAGRLEHVGGERGDVLVARDR